MNELQAILKDIVSGALPIVAIPGFILYLIFGRR